MKRACCLALVLTASCGARSGLRAPRRDGEVVAELDAGPDAARGLDAGPDAAARRDAGGRDAGRSCPEVTATFAREPPMLILLLDRSGSMRLLFRRWTPQFPSASRWEVVIELLVGDPGRVDGIVGDLRARVGLSTFTTELGECPAIRWVPPAFSNLDAIREELMSLSPAGGTPTAEAIRDATARVPSHRIGSEPIAFVLATDGEPNGCSFGDGRAQVIEAVNEAHRQGIRTFVVSVGDDTSLEHLQQVANAGLGLDVETGNAEFWNGRSPARLAQAFDEASARATTCYGELSRSMRDLSRACEIELTIGGEPFTCDDASEGYRFPDEDHIELAGDACAAFQAADEVTLDAPCDLF